MCMPNTYHHGSREVGIADLPGVAQVELDVFLSGRRWLSISEHKLRTFGTFTDCFVLEDPVCVARPFGSHDPNCECVMYRSERAVSTLHRPGQPNGWIMVRNLR